MKGSRITVRLPIRQIAQIRKVARLALVTPSQVAAVILAMEVVRRGRAR